MKKETWSRACAALQSALETILIGWKDMVEKGETEKAGLLLEDAKLVLDVMERLKCPITHE